MRKLFEEIYIECADNNNDMHNLTAAGWAQYQSDRGNAPNNKAKTISTRYKNRKKLGYNLRQVCGFEEISHAVKPKKVKLLVTDMLTEFNRTGRVVGG